MRTTLTLDPDVAQLIEDAVHRERQPMRRVVNDALRRALAPAPERRGRVRIEPHQSVVLAGHDLARLNRLADTLEDAAVLERARPPA